MSCFCTEFTARFYSVFSYFTITFIMPKWWKWKDSNLLSPKTAGLQPVPALQLRRASIFKSSLRFVTRLSGLSRNTWTESGSTRRAGTSSIWVFPYSYGGRGGIRTHGRSFDRLRFSRPVHLTRLCHPSMLLVSRRGFEPRTSALKGRYSSAELTRHRARATQGVGGGIHLESTHTMNRDTN